MGVSFSVDVLDSSGNVLGSGPIPNVISAQIVEELDAAGQVSVSVPATDYQVLTLLQVGRRLRVRTTDGTSREGFIERKTTKGGKMPAVVAGGPDLLDELNRISNGIARIYDNEDVASVVIPNLLSGLAATWTADVAAGLGNVTARFDGGSRLYAIQALRERLGVHFRQSTTPRTLEFKAFGSDSGIRLDNVERWRVDLEDNTSLGIVDNLELVADTTAMVNRVVALGAGDGQGQLDLRYCSSAKAANVKVRSGPRRGDTTGSGSSGAMTITVASASNFAEGDPVFIGDASDLSASHEFNQVASIAGTTITLAGPLQNTYSSDDVKCWPELYIQAGTPTDVRERVMVWKDIAPISNSDADLEAASDALYDVAKAYLDWYSTAQTAYRVTLVSLPTSVHVGDKVRLVYKGAVTRDGTTYSWIDVDELVWILKITRTYNANGMVSVAVDVSDVDRRVVGDDEIIASALQTGEVFKSYTQQYPAVFRDTSREPMDSSHDATVIVDITDDILYLNKCRLRVRTFPFRAFATGAAGGGATVGTTGSGGGGTQTSAGGGGTTATSSSGGGATVTSAGSAHRHVIGVLSEGSITGDSYVADIPASTSGSGDFTKIGQVELEADDDSGTPWARIATYEDSPAHTHSVTISAHTHDVTLSDHTHNVTFPTHTHSVTLSDHTHTLVYGIYEDSDYPDTISLAINGVDVTTELGGTWDTGGAGLAGLELDITQFLRNASGGLRQAHELTWSCTGGQGMIETVVKMLLTAQNIVVS